MLFYQPTQYDDFSVMLNELTFTFNYSQSHLLKTFSHFFFFSSFLLIKCSVQKMCLSLFYLRIHIHTLLYTEQKTLATNQFCCRQPKYKVKFIKYADSQVGFIRSFLIFVKVDLNKCWRKDLSGEWLAVLEFNNIYDLF